MVGSFLTAEQRQRQLVLRPLDSRRLRERKPLAVAVHRRARGRDQVHARAAQRLDQAFRADAAGGHDARPLFARERAVERLAHEMNDPLHAIQRRRGKRLRTRVPLEGRDAAVEHFQRAMRPPRGHARPQAGVDQRLRESPADKPGGPGNQNCHCPSPVPAGVSFITPRSPSRTAQCGNSKAATS